MKPLHSLIAGGSGIWLAWFLITAKRNTVRIGCGMMLAGLIGNVSSMMMGAVPDYFSIELVTGYLWLFFNVSDVAIFAGCLAFAGAVVRVKFSGGTR